MQQLGTPLSVLDSRSFIPTLNPERYTIPDAAAFRAQREGRPDAAARVLNPEP